MFTRLSSPVRSTPIEPGARALRAAAPQPNLRPTLRPTLRLPHAGVLAGTLVETDAGWQPVESLAIGQPVQTWDGGLQPLVRLERRRIAPGAGLVRVPGGVLSACTDLVLLPGQHLLVATGAVAALLDSDMALVPAAALEGWQGVGLHRPRQGFDVISLAFEAEEVVFANTGALLHCAAAEAPARAAPVSEFFTVLDRAHARALLGLDAPAPVPTPARMPALRAAGPAVAVAA